MNRTPTILAVDDEALNLDIIAEFLDGMDLTLETASGGEEAWRKLRAEPGRYDCVLLDRMMPDLDGMEVLLRIKADEALRALPVIMQTAAAASVQVEEGLRAGAFYYLTKPYNRDTLRGVVRTALEDRATHLEVLEIVADQRAALGMMRAGAFAFRTPAQAQVLAALLSQCAEAPNNVALGLNELFLNAIEHGNLEIGYEGKTRLLRAGTLHEEIARRLAAPEYGAREVEVRVELGDGKATYTIRDGGTGFDWSRYLEIAAERAGDTHGRGIALARQLCFVSVAYRGKGNEVVAVAKLHPGNQVGQVGQ
jgi:CheY-like chemotaxis protein/anti-sigma regulatory factor (Ser/Thr protein kinase)